MPIVRRNEPISSWEDGDFIQGFVLLSRKEPRFDRNGREYLDLELCDATAAVAARIWPDNPSVNGDFKEKDFLALKGTVRLYREQPQVIIDFCRRATDDDRAQGFDEGLLVPSTPEDIDDLWRRLTDIYPGQLSRPSLRQLAEEAQRRFGDRLRVHPAAKNIHHAYRGGLLEHVVTMAELALEVAAKYPELDRDLLLLGVYFHDLGKLRELGAMPNNDYTLEGQLIGHITIGAEMLQECAAAVDDLPPELLLHLRHLVLSHHGRREFGSPIEPATVEAFALHHLDNLDSKLLQLRQQSRSGAEGLQYVRALGRAVYFDRPESAEAD
jgi:3'-5' exoribonuclease